MSICDNSSYSFFLIAHNNLVYSYILQVRIFPGTDH